MYCNITLLFNFWQNLYKFQEDGTTTFYLRLHHSIYKWNKVSILEFQLKTIMLYSKTTSLLQSVNIKSKHLKNYKLNSFYDVQIFQLTTSKWEIITHYEFTTQVRSKYFNRKWTITNYTEQVTLPSSFSCSTFCHTMRNINRLNIVNYVICPVITNNEIPKYVYIWSELSKYDPKSAYIYTIKIMLNIY